MPLTHLDQVARLRAEAVRSCERRIIVLEGEPSWARAELQRELELLQLTNVAWLDGDVARVGDLRDKPRALLSRTLDGLVLDLAHGFDPDGFAALSGVVCGGGLVWLLVPGEFVSRVDRGLARLTPYGYGTESVGRRFRARFADAISRARRLWVREPDCCVIPLPDGTRPGAAPVVGRHGARTDDQARAVDALLDFLAAGAGPVVLTGHRGRGKSSALGLFAAHALREHPGLHIAVTAPSEASAQALFERARDLETDLGGLSFVPAEALADGSRRADVVLVDEAGGLSADLLLGILDHAPRAAFATTVHGYEGSGQGFRVRLARALRERFPNVREVALEQPVHFRAGDPVELFTNEAFLLDACFLPDARAGSDAEGAASVTVTRLDRGALAQDEALLRQVFGLFVLCHHRAAPSELWRLLDAPNYEVFVAHTQGRVLGAALTALEGELDAASARAVVRGELRPRGHVLSEAFARSLGRPEAARFRALRFVSIAVHPELSRRGIGSELVQHVALHATTLGVDLLGAECPATVDVLAFFRAQGLFVVHVGTERSGAAGGEVSAIALRGLSERGRAVVSALFVGHARVFPHVLKDGLEHVDPRVVLEVLGAHGELGDLSLTPDEVDALGDALFGTRPYHTVVSELGALILHASRQGLLDAADPGARLAVRKVLCAQSWERVSRSQAFESASAAMQALRLAVLPWFEHALDEAEVARQRARYARE